MIKTPTATRYFNHRREEAQNPYIGIVSFQHFRGEALYSDCIVLPENNYCETEHYECYPVPEYVEQNGRAEGYYPDTSVAYIRVLWKEFEPQRGVYNYDFIQDILDKAKAHGQTVMFRLMAHSTRARDDVPDWLKALIPCPERPDGKRVKDSPTDPLFLELFTLAVRKLGERFDADPTLDTVDISLPGSWGEGHNLHLYSPESLKNIVDTYLDVFKNTHLMSQLFRPELLCYANEYTDVGFRGDGLGQPRHTLELYPPKLLQNTELWKRAPVSFEAYWWLGEWKRRGWDIDSVIQYTLDAHISTMNPKSLPIPFEWRDKIDYWVGKMGYHFALDFFKYPETASAGDVVKFVLGIDNIGVAPIYHKIPFKVCLKGDKTYEFPTGIDIRNWLPGKETDTVGVALPENIEKGEYEVEIGMYNQNVDMIYFATDAPRDGKFYKVGKITII